MSTVLLVLACVVPRRRRLRLAGGGWLRRRVSTCRSRSPRGARRNSDRASLRLPSRGDVLARNGASQARGRVGAARKPDLVCVTGDLVSHPRGERALRALLARLDRPFVVLGNHDVAVTRDPFSRVAELRDLERARLLRDGAENRRACAANESSDRRCRPRELPGEQARPAASSSTACAPFRLLLLPLPGCRRSACRPTSFDLVLAGHLHAGQICVPLGRPAASRSRTLGRGSSRVSTRRRLERCTSRPAPGRRSSRSASSRVPR